MPFKKGDNIGEDNPKFAPNKKHSVETVPMNEANYFKLATGKIIHKEHYNSQGVVDWAKRREDLEDD